MRKILIATLVAAGVAFVGTSAGSAFPVNNMVVKQTETMTAPTTNVQYYRHRRCHGYYSRWHWC
jgi:peptidase E